MNQEKKLTDPRVDWVPSFRAYNKETGMMVYYCEGANPPMMLIFGVNSWGFYRADEPILDTNCMASPVDSILMQGSGRPDKNEVELFEGDLVKDLRSGCDLAQGTDFLYAEIYIRDGVFYENYFNQPIHFYPYLQIIGNKYEDPDLLEMMSINPEEEEDE